MTLCDHIIYKKHIYIRFVNKLNCQFSFASNSTQAILLETYCSAWYGSQDWQLDTAQGVTASLIELGINHLPDK